jgi:hypothetical protein
MYALQLASARPSALVDWNNNYGDHHCGNWAKDFLPDIRIGMAPYSGPCWARQNTVGRWPDVRRLGQSPLPALAWTILAGGFARKLERAASPTTRWIHSEPRRWSRYRCSTSAAMALSTTQPWRGTLRGCDGRGARKLSWVGDPPPRLVGGRRSGRGRVTPTRWWGRTRQVRLRIEQLSLEARWCSARIGCAGRAAEASGLQDRG